MGLDAISCHFEFASLQDSPVQEKQLAENRLCGDI